MPCKRSAAQRRKEELFGDARNEMDELSKRPDATIIEIEQLLAKYRDYPNGRDLSGNDGVRNSRDMLKHSWQFMWQRCVGRYGTSFSRQT